MGQMLRAKAPPISSLLGQAGFRNSADQATVYTYRVHPQVVTAIRSVMRAFAGIYPVSTLAWL